MQVLTAIWSVVLLVCKTKALIEAVNIKSYVFASSGMKDTDEYVKIFYHFMILLITIIMLLLCPLIAIKLLIFCIFEFLYLICNVKIFKFKPCLREKQKHVAMMKAVTCWTGNFPWFKSRSNVSHLASDMPFTIESKYRILLYALGRYLVG